MNDCEYFPCGTLITTKLDSIKGMITAICVRFNDIKYEVSYFNNGDQNSIWMHEVEFDASEEKKSIGFLLKNN